MGGLLLHGLTPMAYMLLPFGAEILGPDRPKAAIPKVSAIRPVSCRSRFHPWLACASQQLNNIQPEQT